MSINTSSYYISIRAKMMREFNAMYRAASTALTRHFSQCEINDLREASERTYSGLLPDLPYIGGNRNSETTNLIMGAIALSIVTPLQETRLDERQIGKVIYDTFVSYFDARPAILRRLLGFLASRSFFVNRMKSDIQRQAQFQHDDGFSMELVEPECNELDFGYNYTRCAVCRLFEKHGASQYVKYVCLGDYALFRSLGIGFSRTQTIGNGAPRCDFRFKRGGDTALGWPPERLPEWERRKG